MPIEFLGTAVIGGSGLTDTTDLEATLFRYINSFWEHTLTVAEEEKKEAEFYNYIARLFKSNKRTKVFDLIVDTVNNYAFLTKYECLTIAKAVELAKEFITALIK